MARKRAGLTQDQLGELIGVGRNAVSAWENDVRLPESEYLLALPDALNVSADVLLLGKAGTSLPREELEAFRAWVDRLLGGK